MAVHIGTTKLDKLGAIIDAKHTYILMLMEICDLIQEFLDLHFMKTFVSVKAWYVFPPALQLCEAGADLHRCCMCTVGLTAFSRSCRFKDSLKIPMLKKCF